MQSEARDGYSMVAKVDMVPSLSQLPGDKWGTFSLVLPSIKV